jgi:hypothetical protein
MVAYARRIRGVGAVLTALALGACSGASCTAIGCDSKVRVDLSGLAEQNPRSPLSVRLCIEGACTDQILTPGADTYAVVTGDLPAGATSGEQRQLRLSVRVTADRRVVADASTTATVKRFAPNGDACDPVCHVVGATLRGGRLIDNGGTPTSTG